MSVPAILADLVFVMNQSITTHANAAKDTKGETAMQVYSKFCDIHLAS